MQQDSMPDQQAAGGYIAQASQGSSAIVNVYPMTPHLRDLNRQRLLAKVRTFWIAGVLEQSLHGAALMALGLQDIPAAVQNPWQMLIQEANQPMSSLPSGTPIIQIYDQADGELLILGAPGAGKTTLFLQLARHLLDRAERDEAHPIPVVFHLASWAMQRQSLSAWLIDELNSRYQVPPSVSRQWIDANQILPLLDGLDEVKRTCQAPCVEAINAYRREHGLLPLVVCCRSADYEALQATTRLLLQKAIIIQPLTADQIDAYLASGGEPLAAIRTLLQKDRDLREMATTPLMLNVLTLAYAGSSLDALTTTSSPPRRRQQVFTTYVDRMLHRRGRETRYPPERTIHWLSWLGQQLDRQSLTVFHLERMQPVLISQVELRWYRFLVPMGLAVLIGLVAWLSFVLYQALYWLPSTLSSSGWAGVRDLLSTQVVWLLSQGILVQGLLFGALCGLLYCLLCPIASTITPAEMITWSWSTLVLRLWKSGAVRFGCVCGLLGWVVSQTLILGVNLYTILPASLYTILPTILFFGLFGGWLFVCLRSLLHSWSSEKAEAGPRTSEPPAHRVAHPRLLIGVTSGLVMGLMFGLAFGLLRWLIRGLAILASPESVTSDDLLLSVQLIPRNALISGLLIGGLGGLLLGWTSRVEIPLRPVSLLVWEWKQLWRALSQSDVLVQGIAFGLMVGLFGVMADLLIHSTWPAALSDGVRDGLLGSLLFILFSVLIGGLSSQLVEEQALVRPNQGMRRSARNSILVGLVCGLLAWVIFGVVHGLRTASIGGLQQQAVDFGLSWGLALALLSAWFIALSNGGLACVQYGILRLLLWRSGVIPWKYTHFLDYAAERILLRKVGGGYIFVHRLLQEHFASLMPLSPSPSTHRQETVPQTVARDEQIVHYGARNLQPQQVPEQSHSGGHPPSSAASLPVSRRWVNLPLIIVGVGLALSTLVVPWLDWDAIHHRSVYPPPHWRLVLDDPLTKNTSNALWDEGAFSGGACRFLQGAYHISSQHKHWITYCLAQKTHYRDFTLEVEMTIINGGDCTTLGNEHGCGALELRYDTASDSFYEFWMEGRKNSQTNPGYGLKRYQQGQWTELRRGGSTAISQDPHTPNLLAVVARGNSFDLYVNHHLLTTYSDDSPQTLRQGYIALGVEEFEKPTEVVYRHVRIWTPER